MAPNETLRFTSGSWHSSKIDEIPLPASCGQQFCVPPTTFDSQTTREISALNDLYNALDGARWAARYGWGEGHPCFQFWYGVECNAQARVFRLQLQNNGLLGTIPPSIANLTHLIEINFRSLSDYSIPSSIANVLYGTFPSVASLKELRTLDLSGTRAITALPSDLSSNEKLEVLDASGNMLRLLPAGLENITSLKILRLRDNLISDTFPVGICKLVKLLVFNVAGSLLTGTIPECIATSLNPIVFDISTTLPGVTGEVPLTVIDKWTNIKKGYLSIYGHYDMTGTIADICTSFNRCYYHIFQQPINLVSATQQSQVPQIVIDTMNLATR